MKLAGVILAAFIVSDAFAADVKQGEFGAARGQTPPAAAPSISIPGKTEKGKRSTYPFSGELDSHGPQSISLKGKKKNRLLLLTPTTRVLRAGSAAKLAEAKPGERVSGSARKNPEGKEEAVTINLKGQP